MANDVPVTAPYRDYYLTAPERTKETASRGLAYFVLQDDGTSFILLDDGASKLLFRDATLTATYSLAASFRDYFLTAPERQ